MPGAGIMVNFTAVEPPLNANRFSYANHSEVFSWMVTDSRGKTQTFQTFDFKDHPVVEPDHYNENGLSTFLHKTSIIYSKGGMPRSS